MARKQKEPKDPKNTSADDSPFPRDPGSGREGPVISETDEQAARDREGVGLHPRSDKEGTTESALRSDQTDDFSISGQEELDEGQVIPSGTQTGQTARGSYATDQSTGAGAYMDRRSGSSTNDPVAQAGEDDEREPDPVDPKI